MEKRGTSGKAQLIVMNSIRLLLIIAVVMAIYNERRLVLFMSLLGIFVTFVPLILRRLWKVKIPGDAEIIIILFIYGILLMTNIGGLFREFLVWGALINASTSIALGLVGLTVMHFLHEENKINASPLAITFFAFCFAVAIGAIWEVFEFSLDNLFSFSIQKSLLDTMVGMSFNIAGALVVSSIGYYYIKTGKKNPASDFIIRIMEKNPFLFKSKRTGAEEKIINLINKGEHENLEFKSTMRTNLHTKEADPRLEHSILKTINAYLNSNGGTLLVGVSDKGEILGLDVDKFENKDKLNLHFTNLIKNHIGNEHLPFIKHEIIPVSGKDILKIDCLPSKKHVFLRNGQEEEFYVRNGPSSAKLSGSSLIDYVNNKFNNGIR